MILLMWVKMEIVVFVLLQVLGKGEAFWPLVQTQLEAEVYQHHQLYSNVFYGTLFEVRSSLRVASRGVQDREK